MAEVTLMSILRWTDQECCDYLEAQRWPDGPVCPKCRATDPYRIDRQSLTKNLVKKLYRCRDCKRQYTATIGTMFEDSKIPLSKWFVAIDMMCASKNGLNAHQIHREMGVTYKSAWFMCHRVREALAPKQSQADFRTNGRKRQDTTTKLDMSFEQAIRRVSRRSDSRGSGSIQPRESVAARSG